MNNRFWDRCLLWVSVGAFLMLAFSFLLMPIQTLEFLPGCLFWTGLICGLVTQIVLTARRKRRWTGKKKGGFFQLFANRRTRIADTVMLAGGAAFLIAMLLTQGGGYICYVLMGITLFAFSLHCVLGGRNYDYAMNREPFPVELNKKKVKKKG